ncbi:DUF397 domain-containing protein [Actinospica sp.]|jgi:hypothetical protein|uniref:DUF397 domain-containing protein n=1 Tax=Actinospica sp. TaxID=1872142 RepID=UPI002CACDD5A|nr:DUF397 domain-containing protein [Actinospica sp.]HWG27078.1 DUF397 domain-containing protein [Actinospica sp.]
MSKNTKITNWRKSSYSGSQGNCVEFAPFGADAVAVRNSRDPEGAVLFFDRVEMGAFLAAVKSGELDNLG